MFPPAFTVSGLSVLYLKVIHGTLSVIASSCNPPESVITNFDFEISNRKSKYPMGLMSLIWDALSSLLYNPNFFRVFKCSWMDGKITVMFFKC